MPTRHWHKKWMLKILIVTNEFQSHSKVLAFAWKTNTKWLFHFSEVNIIFLTIFFIYLVGCTQQMKLEKVTSQVNQLFDELVQARKKLLDAAQRPGTIHRAHTFWPISPIFLQIESCMQFLEAGIKCSRHPAWVCVKHLCLFWRTKFLRFHTFRACGMLNDVCNHVTFKLYCNIQHIV